MVVLQTGADLLLRESVQAVVLHSDVIITTAGADIAVHKPTLLRPVRVSCRLFLGTNDRPVKRLDNGRLSGTSAGDASMTMLTTRNAHTSTCSPTRPPRPMFRTPGSAQSLSQARGYFPTEQAALRRLYLVIISLDPHRTASAAQLREGRPERLRQPSQRRQEANLEN